ncbi:BNR-4 repeat-containing protein [uncultured Cyclobacterium sp.]|uniref:BNR-4 repeat-containing protein n=1 Tax=uncultured Cyclobacterium sp. TaxID=453820 RepID=UPI0030EC578C|tara:strand:+ start:139240 stop:141303 length:2064 start_codon:yes stop_codon:yes gene_type:complete
MITHPKNFFFAIVLILLQFTNTYSQSSLGENFDPYQPVKIAEDGSWCWFQDERALLIDNKVFFTGVTAKGYNTVSEWNLDDYSSKTTVITEGSLPADDHNVGSLMLRPDGKILTVYSGHTYDDSVRYRTTVNPFDISEWTDESSFIANAKVCYSNTYYLEEADLTYNFFRGNGNNPHYMVSKDYGDSWTFGGRLFEFPGRSYLRYASDGKNRVHFITTDGHPRHMNNNVYHGYIENGNAYKSDGTLVGPLSTTENSKFKPSDFTIVFDGDLETREDIGWTSDIQLDDNGSPYFVFSVTKDPVTRGERFNVEKGGFDNRYHYARWESGKWIEDEIAYAGSRLYPSENEYTGLISLNPKDKNILYFSGDVHPVTGDPLLVDGERRYEIFRGERLNEESPWEFTPVTFNSKEDNLRPIVLADDNREIVLWLTGRYTTYKDYQLKVYGKVIQKKKTVKKNENKKITFLISKDPDNYEADLTIPYFAMKLAKESGFETEVILGEGKRNEFKLPALEKNMDSDLLVFFLRRVALSSDQMQLIKNHIAAGKPVLGIRTANHAFTVREGDIPSGYEDWENFVPEVLGHENKGYGAAREPTQVVTKQKPGKKILKDIPGGKWESQGNLYLIGNTLDNKAKVILSGTSDGKTNPIAYTRKFGKSRVFYTSLGYPTDFTHPYFIQFLKNAIDWTLKIK